MPGFFLSIQCLCNSATMVTQLSGSEFLYCKVVSHCTNTPAHLPLQLWMDTGFRGGPSGKEPSCRCKRRKRRSFHLWIRKTPWRRPWQLTPVFLPGESLGQRSLGGYSPRGHTESDMPEMLSVRSWMESWAVSTLRLL